VLLDEINRKLFLKSILEENNQEKSLEMEKKKGIQETAQKIMEDEANNKIRKLDLKNQRKLENKNFLISTKRFWMKDIMTEKNTKRC